MKAQKSPFFIYKIKPWDIKEMLLIEETPTFFKQFSISSCWVKLKPSSHREKNSFYFSFYLCKHIYSQIWSFLDAIVQMYVCSLLIITNYNE